MNKPENQISSALLGQTVYRREHPCGLTVLMCPMPGFATACAVFGAKVGSVDNSFRFAGETQFTDVPAGIAHFLEHKMFECEEGDAFQRYSETGASANAYTSFDRTAYFFNCTQNFIPSLEILLDFVTHPYFTKETVEKEQGIIGQEIRMYDDNPDWRVLFNLLCGLYENNPVRLDIAGTQESIAQIDSDLLYRCYNAFYNPANMVLTVAGNIDCDAVMDACDRILPNVTPRPIERRLCQEPRAYARPQITQRMAVASPIFELGFKSPPKSALENAQNSFVDELLAEIICGEASDLYREMYDSGLVNSAFGSEVLSGRDYLCTMFGGESPDPARAAEKIRAQVRRLREQGIPEEDFLRCRKLAYGRYISLFCKPDGIAGLLVSAHFSGIDDIFSLLPRIGALSLAEAQRRLCEDYDPDNCTLSVVEPADREKR